MLITEIKNDSPVELEAEQIRLLSPFERQVLQSHLHRDSRPEYRRRIEIMLLADLGKSQSEICATLNCSNVTARYWIWMAKNGQALQWNNVPIGRPKTVNDQYINRLQELVTHSPQEFGYSFHRWTAQWLSKHLAKEFGIAISDRHINRLLKKMGLSTRFKRSSQEATQKRQTIKGFGLVISELNTNLKSNSFSLGPFNPNRPIV
ncbi:MAG: helix-turn-helix domain-containing protein [Cyanobacteria bacterium P01_G01_bin.67]